MFCTRMDQSINQPKHISIAPYVASESEAHGCQWVSPVVHRSCRPPFRAVSPCVLITSDHSQILSFLLFTASAYTRALGCSQTFGDGRWNGRLQKLHPGCNVTFAIRCTCNDFANLGSGNKCLHIPCRLHCYKHSSAVQTLNRVFLFQYCCGRIWIAKPLASQLPPIWTHWKLGGGVAPEKVCAPPLFWL